MWTDPSAFEQISDMTPWPFEVWLDAAPLAPPRTGIGRYCAGLLRGFRELGDQHGDPCLSLLHADGTVTSELEGNWHNPIDDERLHNPTTHWKGRLLSGLRDAARSLPGSYTLRDEVRAYRLRSALESRLTAKPVVLHASTFIPPRVPEHKFDALAVTIHDLSCFDIPDMHPPERVRRIQKLLPGVVEKANVVFCVSRYTASRAQSFLSVDPKKIFITPLGVESFFFDEALQKNRSCLNEYGLTPGKYWLSIATLEPRKNLETVLRAFRALPTLMRLEYPLIIAGTRGWMTSSLEREIVPLLDEGSARLLGYVPDRNLPSLYHNSTATIYLSRYEGFGLPAAEAMACGSLVISSNTTAMPEVIGDTGVLLSPDDQYALSDTMLSVVEHPESFIRYRQKARALANKSLRWTSCANLTLEGYRLGLGLSSPQVSSL